MPLGEQLGASGTAAEPGETALGPRPVSLPRGTVLEGRYAIDRELGRGGMGAVFAARDTKLGRDVAVKVLTGGVQEPAQLARLGKEARAAGSLAHPNVLAIYDIGSFEGGPYLVAELLQGATLRELLGRGPLPPQRAINLAAQLAKGLAAAHDQGIVHRDIKPENLFITEDGWLKILDFGIASLLPSASQAPGPRTSASGAIVGSPGYMSPEQIQGRPVDARSDLFGFGAVLHEMLSGRQAFDRPSAVETAYSILHDPPAPLPAAVPQALHRIVLRCLEKDPKARYQSARDLAADLEMLGSAAPPRGELRQRLIVIASLGLTATLILAVTLLPRFNRPQQSFRQLTFHPGAVSSARFGPDGQTVFYSLAADSPGPQLFSTSISSPEARRLEAPPANLLAVSAGSELAVLLRPRVMRFGFDHGTLARLLPAAGAPRELLEDVEAADWAPDGSGLAVVRTVASRGRLEYPVNHVLFETTGWISSPRFSPDGKRLAFLHHPNPVDDSGVVMVCDLAGQAHALTASWRSAGGLAWAKRGSEIWFTAVAANTPAATAVLRAVDLSGEQRVLAQVGGDLKLEDVAPDGRALLTQPDRRLGLAVMGKGDEKPRDLTWFDQAFLTDLSAGGGEVLFTVGGAASGSDSVVYLRKTDGSPAVRLGDGYAGALSPDGRWVVSLSLLAGPVQPLKLLPTGAGEPRSLDAAGVTVTRVRWFPDGKRLLIAGLEPGHATRLYVRDVEGGKPRAISEEGVSSSWLAISRDGRLAAAVGAGGRTALYPVDGTGPVQLPELSAADVPFGFGNDGSLYIGIGAPQPLGAPVYAFDLSTRRKRMLRTLFADAPGARAVMRIQVSPDGSTFAFNYVIVTSHLYLFTGSG